MSNLRINTGRNTGNREGGVQFIGDKPNNKRRPWRARIMIDGRRLHLGNFKTQDEAEEAYRNAYKEKTNNALGFLRG